MIIPAEKESINIPQAPGTVHMTLRPPPSKGAPAQTTRYPQSSGSGHGLSPITTTRSPPVIPVRSPEPPPYSEAAFPVIQPPPPLPSPSSTQNNIHAVNQLHIDNNREDVFGTFAIDPLLPLPAKHKPKKSSRKKKAPDASFKTKHGAVSINLATKGDPVHHSKAFVEVATRKGDVNVDLFSIQARKHVHLDVYSRKGNVLVLVPRNFCGCIQIRSRRKGYQILPALSAVARAQTTTDKEMLVMIGDPSSNQTDNDYLQMESRHGKVIVGFSNEDVYQPNETTFWQKVFGIKKS